MVILLEFNEICPTLLQQFMARGELPNFRRFYESSQVYVTDAREEHPNLEPWIQWVTVHSGKPYDDHGVFYLGDGRNLRSKCVAELLSDAGIRVGVFGSMNTNYTQLNGYFVPDPWDKDGKAHPSWLQPYYDVVSRQVQAASHKGPMSTADKATLAWFLARHGLRFQSGVAVIKQLLAERKQPALEWRRASLFEELQYDLFRWLNRKFKTQFATLFCNSTAHYQHYFWRNMEPEKFDRPPDATDDESLRSAIHYGYERMDCLLGRVQNDYPDATLILCSALSQKPWVDTVKCTYRPSPFERLLTFAGIDAAQVEIRPVMAEDFFIDCRTSEDASSVIGKLEGLRVDGEQAMRIRHEGNSVWTQCVVTTSDINDLAVVNESTGSTMPFRELFQMVHSMRSGRHHPDGVLWIRNGTQHVHQEKVSLSDIAPTILELFGVPQPESMLGQALRNEEACALLS